MLFTSPFFLFVFLPLGLLLYSVTPNHLKKASLLIVNIFYIFLFSDSPYFVLLYFIATVFYTYLAGREIRASGSKRSVVFFLSLEVFLFFVFRYVAFLDSGKASLFNGTAFLLLASISYMIDIYRKDSIECTSLLDASVYMSFFPVLVAGPIIKYKDFLVILERRNFKIESFSRGVILFCIGFIKKTIVASTLSDSVNALTHIYSDEISASAYFFICIFYFIKVVFDLWGYSDMARGLAFMFGLSIPENFKNCLGALSVKDFFDNFFVSLSSWAKDYLYTPFLTYLKKHGLKNIFIPVFLCCILAGLWFNTNFLTIILAFFISIFMCIEMKYPSLLRIQKKVVINILCRVLNIVVFSAAFYIFRVSSFSHIWEEISKIQLGPVASKVYLVYPAIINLKFVFALLVVFAVLLQPLFERFIRPRLGEKTVSVYRMIYNILVVAVFCFSVLYFLPQYSAYFSSAFDFLIF